jgi:dienelactone hydrolase
MLMHSRIFPVKLLLDVRFIAITILAMVVTNPCAEQSTRMKTQQVEISTVYFPTKATGVFFGESDTPRGTNELVGYLYKPQGRGPFPAVVMMHGRAGPYSTSVNESCTFVQRGVRSDCSVDTLSARARMWGMFWAEQGVLAIHVDSFGPRGRAHGYGRNTHGDADREAVNELTVRPLDAEDALAYLYLRGDVKTNQIALQGWSNGASTALNLADLYKTRRTRMQGFQQALVFYPGCGPKALRSNNGYQAGVPTTVFLAGKDEEVNPEICRKVLAGAIADLSDGKRTVAIINYDGATHDFDDPGKARQSVPANAEAKADAMARALQIIKAMTGK